MQQLLNGKPQLGVYFEYSPEEEGPFFVSGLSLFVAAVRNALDDRP